MQIGPVRYHLYLRVFKWGVIGHVRWRLTWRHLKVEVFLQKGLRVSTRRQLKKYRRKPRYCNAVRLHTSWWKSHKGEQGKSRAIGVLFYR